MKIDVIHRLDLKHMTYPEAMEQAKMLSGKTNEQIARELSISLGRETPLSAAAVQGWFDLRRRDYWPSTIFLPALCRVLGNSIIIDWLVEQTRDVASCELEASTGNLLASLPGVVKQFGLLGERVGVAVEDGAVTPREARDILGEVAGLRAHLDNLESLLSSLAEQAKRRR
jgi:hypothetical protein